VIENRMLREISGPQMDEVTGEWRKLRNEELHNLYSSTNMNMMRVLLSCVGTDVASK
jgi:hypothetical protein